MVIPTSHIAHCCNTRAVVIFQDVHGLHEDSFVVGTVTISIEMVVGHTHDLCQSRLAPVQSCENWTLKESMILYFSSPTWHLHNWSHQPPSISSERRVFLTNHRYVLQRDEDFSLAISTAALFHSSKKAAFSRYDLSQLTAAVLGLLLNSSILCRPQAPLARHRQSLLSGIPCQRRYAEQESARLFSS